MEHVKYLHHRLGPHSYYLWAFPISVLCAGKHNAQKQQPANPQGLHNNIPLILPVAAGGRFVPGDTTGEQ